MDDEELNGEFQEPEKEVDWFLIICVIAFVALLFVLATVG